MMIMIMKIVVKIVTTKIIIMVMKGDNDDCSAGLLAPMLRLFFTKSCTLECTLLRNYNKI
jgi:hypothetical protein